LLLCEASIKERYLKGVKLPAKVTAVAADAEMCPVVVKVRPAAVIWDTLETLSRMLESDHDVSLLVPSFSA
jgi:hypothetical protein